MRSCLQSHKKVQNLLLTTVSGKNSSKVVFFLRGVGGYTIPVTLYGIPMPEPWPDQEALAEDMPSEFMNNVK